VRDVSIAKMKMVASDQKDVGLEKVRNKWEVRWKEEEEGM
jgi:hypothetical protein